MCLNLVLISKKYKPLYQKIAFSDHQYICHSMRIGSLKHTSWEPLSNNAFMLYPQDDEWHGSLKWYIIKWYPQHYDTKTINTLCLQQRLAVLQIMQCSSIQSYRKTFFFFQQPCIICLMCKVFSKPHSTCASIPTTQFLCGLTVRNYIELIQEQFIPFIGIIKICINCSESFIMPEKLNVFCNVWPLFKSCLSCAHFLIAVMPTLEAALAMTTNATRSTYNVLLNKYSMQLIS